MITSIKYGLAFFCAGALGFLVMWSGWHLYEDHKAWHATLAVLSTLQIDPITGVVHIVSTPTPEVAPVVAPTSTTLKPTK